MTTTFVDAYWIRAKSPEEQAPNPERPRRPHIRVRSNAMPAVDRCVCGQTIRGTWPDARCDACGRIARAGVAPGTTKTLEEALEFSAESECGSPRPLTSCSVAGRMLEAMLDPWAIRWLLGLGGALSVLGLIIWAYSKVMFDSPLHQAAAFGLGTLALFTNGWWLTLRTRHKTAGVAVTFLGAVVAPLNLWFYDAQKLLTIDGHLWTAGLVCCGLYTATLLALHRPVFLYAFQIGVTLTVLLLLGHLGEVGVTSLSATLAVLGAAALHLERAFPNGGLFEHSRFGPPLLWTGLAQLAVAIVGLATAQGFTWLHLPEGSIDQVITPERLAITPLAAAALWLVSAYCTLYAAIVPRLAGGWTMLASAGCLLMAEATVLIGANATAEGAVIALALTGGATCVAAARLPGRVSLPGQAAVAAALVLSSLPILLGYLLLARGAMPSVRQFGWARPIDESYALAMTLVSVCLAASAVSLHGRRRANVMLRFLTAGGVLLAAAGAAQLVGTAPWSLRATFLTLIPLAYLIEGTLWKDDTDVSIAHTAFGLFGASMFLAVCHQGLGLFIPTQGNLGTLGLTVVTLEITTFLLMTAVRFERLMRSEWAVTFAFAAAGSVVMTTWQGLTYLGRFETWHVAVLLAPAVISHAASRHRRPDAASRSLFTFGSSLLLATFAATNLRGLGLAAADQLEWRHLIEVLSVTTAALVAASLAPSRGWRRGCLTASALSAATAVLLLSSLADLTAWQRLEILCVTVGMLLLAAGHVARFRESVERQDDLVDFSLWSGAALVAFLLAGTAFYHRCVSPPRSLPDEIALVSLGLLMLAAGIAFRLKATTIFGGGAVGGYLLVLLVSLLRRPEVTMGAYLAGAGAALFFVGLALSVYRDRLLSLPDRISNHEGLFRILDWR